MKREHTNKSMQLLLPLTGQCRTHEATCWPSGHRRTQQKVNGSDRKTMAVNWPNGMTVGVRDRVKPLECVAQLGLVQSG